MKTTVYLPTAVGLNIVSGSGNNWFGRTVLNGTQLQCVALDATVAQRVYCGTFGQGVLISEDAGVTWHRGRDMHASKATAVFASHTGAIYAGTEPSEVYRSTDAGETWQASASLLTVPSAITWSFPPRPKTHHIQAILEDNTRPGRLHIAVEAGALLQTKGGGGAWQDRVPGGP